jgi:hypothetical protein
MNPYERIVMFDPNTQAAIENPLVILIMRGVEERHQKIAARLEARWAEEAKQPK